MPLSQDHDFMTLALAQARAAASEGEVPVGAVVVRDGQVIAVGHNAPVASHDPTAHAEVNALRAAAKALGNYRLDGCTLYVTLEPCAMCASAALQARIARIVYGAPEPKTGAAGSVIDLFAQPLLNHQTRIAAGVLAQECAQLLQSFFEARRSEQAVSRTPLRDDALRTPEACFDGLNLPLHMSRYTFDLPALQGLRLHWFDNRADIGVPPTVYLHGPDDWSAGFLPELRSGAPAIALDWIGFGRSDKPKKESAHTWDWHTQVLAEFLQSLHPQPEAMVVSEALKPVWPALASRLVSAGAAGCPVRWVPARQALTPQGRQAPYPDRGHQAGPRAWRQLLSPAE